MNIYFADRRMNILGSASTGLPSGLVASEDKRTEDVETGIAVFECKVRFDANTRDKVESLTAVGNFVLRSHGKDNEFFTIIESECDTKKQCVYIYAEDAGLDLLNEVVGEYAADGAKTINHYIETFAYDSGFVVGTNEVAGVTKQLSFDDEETVTARLAKVAEAFGCEISYSYKIKGLYIKNKYINIHQKRGQDLGITLRLNKDIDSIVTTKSIANLATALRCTGGTPEDKEDPITLRGYSYDDGDFYIDGDTLKSRTALSKWSRYMWADEPNLKPGHEGHIVKPFSYDTTSQKTLLDQSIAELKLAREMELNFEVEIRKLPDNVRIGDRVNIVDEAGKLYLSTRILQLEVSVADQEQKATLGEHLIKSNGIHQKVQALASQFSKVAHSASRALMVANLAKTAATEAQTKADEAVTEAANAQQKADKAAEAANTATQSAANAQEKADGAQIAVEKVEKDIESMETTVANAQAAAQQAQQAANTAETKATEAQAAAVIAQTKADETAANLAETQEKADAAIEMSETAKSTADLAKAKSEEAATTAAAAKADAEQAQREIDTMGENLTTLQNTMSVEYARKTDLTETEASLQTQISQNAAEIKSTASTVQTIDETTNDAQKQLLGALAWAEETQRQADEAEAEAEAAQAEANEAMLNANAAQSEADTAKAAAETAKSVADQAKADLEAAKADLETISGRADATEAEILAAQEAVEAAQTAANKAKEDADTAAEVAAEAQAQANKAISKADTAQMVADMAATKATNAQKLAEQAKGDATAAQAAANEAAQAAATAQETANTAMADALDARTKADAAAQAAADAKINADEADAKAAQAAVDLATAQQNFDEVTSRVDATEEEVAAAQAAVDAAQRAASNAEAEADSAQEAADKAMEDAVAAQTVADAATLAANEAQATADEVWKVYDEAKLAVDGLAKRTADAATEIRQNANQIELRATKEEVAKTLGGYSTKEQTEAAISVKADEINLSVDAKIEDVNGNITEKDKSIRADTESIVLAVKESSVQKTDYAEYQETMEARLEALADQIVMKFNAATDAINGVDKETQSQFAEIYKHITFNLDGITIGVGENAVKLNLDNDQVVFSKGNTELVRLDINNFTPANITMKKPFSRLTLGNFAWEVQEDGTPIFLKVGG